MRTPVRHGTSISLEVEASPEYDIKLTARRDNSLPPFMMMGRKGVNRFTGAEGMDTVDTLLSLASNSNATWLFWLLVKGRDAKTNRVVIEPKNFTEAEVTRIKRGRRELEKLGWITRYKNNHYLINPKVLLPMKESYKDICDHWLEVTGEDLNSSVFKTS